MTPAEASRGKKNEGTVYFNLFGDMKPILTKTKYKLVIRSEYLSTNGMSSIKDIQPNWSEEVFTVDKIQYTNPINLQTQRSQW